MKKFLAALLLILAPNLGRATTIYISNTGTDGAAGTVSAPVKHWNAATKALLAKGDTLRFSNGTYPDFCMSSSVTIPSGTGYLANSYYFLGNTTNPENVKIGSSCSGEISADYVEFRGFQFEGGFNIAGSANNVRVYDSVVKDHLDIEGADDCRVENIQLRDFIHLRLGDYALTNLCLRDTVRKVHGWAQNSCNETRGYILFYKARNCLMDSSRIFQNIIPGTAACNSTHPFASFYGKNNTFNDNYFYQWVPGTIINSAQNATDDENTWFIMRDSTYQNSWARDTIIFEVENEKADSRGVMLGHSGDVGHSDDNNYDSCIFINRGFPVTTGRNKYYSGAAAIYQAPAVNDTITNCLFASERNAALVFWAQDDSSLISHNTFVSYKPTYGIITFNRAAAGTKSDHDALFRHNMFVSLDTARTSQESVWGYASDTDDSTITGGAIRAKRNLMSLTRDTTGAHSWRVKSTTFKKVGIGTGTMAALNAKLDSTSMHGTTNMLKSAFNLNIFDPNTGHNIPENVVLNFAVDTTNTLVGSMGAWIDPWLVPSDSAATENYVGSTITLADATPPNRVNNLTATCVRNGTIDVQWTAPVGLDTGSSYDLRMSTSTITSDSFSSEEAIYTGGTSVVAGTGCRVRVDGLNPSLTYFFAIKASDSAGNASALSNVPFARATKTRGGTLQQNLDTSSVPPGNVQYPFVPND